MATKKFNRADMYSANLAPELVSRLTQMGPPFINGHENREAAEEFCNRLDALGLRISSSGEQGQALIIANLMGVPVGTFAKTRIKTGRWGETSPGFEFAPFRSSTNGRRRRGKTSASRTSITMLGLCASVRKAVADGTIKIDTDTAMVSRAMLHEVSSVIHPINVQRDTYKKADEIYAVKGFSAGVVRDILGYVLGEVSNVTVLQHDARIRAAYADAKAACKDVVEKAAQRDNYKMGCVLVYFMPGVPESGMWITKTRVPPGEKDHAISDDITHHHALPDKYRGIEAMCKVRLQQSIPQSFNAKMPFGFGMHVTATLDTGVTCDYTSAGSGTIHQVIAFGDPEAEGFYEA